MIGLDALLLHAQMHHSEFQMDRFITVRAGGTLYGCYRQACRELMTRWVSLCDRWQRRELQAERRKRYSAGDSKRAAMKAIRVRQSELSGMLDDAEVQREFLRFYGIAASLHRALDFDKSPPTADKLRELDVEFWDHQIRAMLALDLMTAGSPQRTTLEMIQCLPVPQRKEIWSQCLANDDAKTRCVNWYLEFMVDLPKPLELSPAEGAELLKCCESSPLLNLSPNSLRTVAQQFRATSTPSASESANLTFVADDTELFAESAVASSS
jgi:hypothetical protein